jgi:hypothetical protein
LKAHVDADVLINAVLLVVWALTGGGAFQPRRRLPTVRVALGIPLGLS